MYQLTDDPATFSTARRPVPCGVIGPKIINVI